MQNFPGQFEPPDWLSARGRGLQVIVSNPLEGIVAMEIVTTDVIAGVRSADPTQCDGGELGLQVREQQVSTQVNTQGHYTGKHTQIYNTRRYTTQVHYTGKHTQINNTGKHTQIYNTGKHTHRYTIQVNTHTGTLHR